MAACGQLRTFTELQQQPVNDACANEEDQRTTPPRNRNSVVVFSKINIPAHLLSLPRPICVVAGPNVGVVKVVMQCLRGGVDWQLPLKLARQPFHFKPIGRLSFLNG